MEELRQALADILCLEVSVTLSLSASRETDNGTSGTSFQDLLPDFRLGPEELALRRALLRHFGRFVQGGRMSRGQRSSVSLNLEREALLDHLELLPTELAAVLDTPAPEFIREVWLRLPFQDLQIAAFLGLPDGPSPAERRAASLKVTNCRMTAMRDAWPRWLGETGWGSEQAARSTQRAARQEG